MKRAISVLVAAVLCGCAANQDAGPTDAAGGDAFAPPDSGTRSVQMIAARQAALGARHDAMLYDDHFHGGALNGLGQAKLDAMLDAPVTPAVVYLNVKSDEATSRSRRDSVEQYFKQRQMNPDEYRIESGINTATLHGAAPELSRMSKTENPRAGYSGATAGGATGGGAGSDTGGSDPTSFKPSTR
jgi:hypothetical protein